MPLHSWYDAAFDEHDPRPGAVRFDKHCRWPVDDEAVSQLFAQLCRRRVRDANYLPAPGGARERGRGGAAARRPNIITLSHFLPRRELPYPAHIHEFAKCTGSLTIEEHVRALGARLHVYGHTHINAWHELDGVHYVQHALGYGVAVNAPLQLVWDGKTVGCH